jgi:asparagine synthase (glutamine-hydrolysing)
MCGLAFAYDLERNGESRVQSSVSALRHRGPDESGVLVNKNACLGHVRLSIVDLSGSQQPMRSRDGRYAIVFNGEIYNYGDLREELKSEWNFTTDGDTEVLLAGLVLYGEKYLTRVEGMWAFALWDSMTESLLLSRDRMGKKPLYYSLDRQGITCASELPALRAMAIQGWSEDENSIADYLRFGYFLPGYTAWNGVFEVLPGHWMRWSVRGGLDQKSYWKLPLPNDAYPKPNDEELIDILKDAVQKRLIADVEVGAFLSGGVDSSLICALAQPMLSRQLKTFTIGFPDTTYDESKYAEIVSKHLGTDHSVRNLSGWSELRLEELLRDNLGQPFADSSLLPTALVSDLASEQVKVVLSGDGGDELFCGYQRYMARMILRWYTRLPIGMRKLAESAIRMLPEPTAHHSRNLLKKAHLFVDIAARVEDETPYIAPVMFHKKAYGEIFPGLVGYGQKPPHLLEETEIDDLQRMLYSDALVYLPQDILIKVDRASMAHSLEVRSPFLDRKVVEFAFRTPVNEHCVLGKSKRILNRVYSDILPREIWKRKKQGFAVPLQQWFRNDLGARLDAYLDNAPEFMRTAEVRKLLKEHISGSRDNGYRLWLIFVYLFFRQSCS